jgi:hypothetical protein
MRLFVFTTVVATQLVAVGRLDAQTPSLGAPVVTSIPIGGITFRDTTTVRHFTYSVSKARPMALASDESGTSAVKRGAWIGAGVGVVAGGIGGFVLAGSIGCTRVLGSPPCSRTGDQVGAVVSASVLGAGVGALLGAAIGKLVQVATPDGAVR